MKFLIKTWDDDENTADIAWKAIKDYNPDSFMRSMDAVYSVKDKKYMVGYDKLKSGTIRIVICRETGRE